MSAPLLERDAALPPPAVGISVTYTLMAGPTIPEVLAPASPSVARTPLAIGCLCEYGCCKLRPCCGCTPARGTHLPQAARLHARTPAMRLLLRTDANRRGFTWRVPLVTLSGMMS